ncbi:MAG: phage terminase small subunit P27 family [Candidatus Eisenbacteria bacterium]|nr:phage terminase small subunit P27 family [Candidatus Eisenbacteria bacterium]
MRAVEGGGHRTKAELKRYDSEPSPRPIRPDPPDYLGQTGLVLWRELADELDAMSTLALVDRHVLGLYCNAFERWREAEDNIDADKAVVKSISGHPMPSPWVSIRNRAIDDMRKFGFDLGISAAARTRISVETPGSKDMSRVEDVIERTLRIAATRVDAKGREYIDRDGIREYQ